MLELSGNKISITIGGQFPLKVGNSTVEFFNTQEERIEAIIEGYFDNQENEKPLFLDPSLFPMDRKQMLDLINSKYNTVDFMIGKGHNYWRSNGHYRLKATSYKGKIRIEKSKQHLIAYDASLKEKLRFLIENLQKDEEINLREVPFFWSVPDNSIAATVSVNYGGKKKLHNKFSIHIVSNILRKISLSEEKLSALKTLCDSADYETILRGV